MLEGKAKPSLRILHIGCGPNTFIEGMENTDKEEFDVLSAKAWAEVESNSVDAFVAMHVLQEFPWRNLIAFLDQVRRTLKPGGVLRLGVPHIDSGKTLQYILSWGNINLFSEEILTKVIEERGFAAVKKCDFKVTGTDIENITAADNRADETLFLEAYK